jgi:hypothetical protein
VGFVSVVEIVKAHSALSDRSYTAGIVWCWVPPRARASCAAIECSGEVETVACSCARFPSGAREHRTSCEIVKRLIESPAVFPART